VIFEAYRSNSYACSPRAIYEYMLGSPDYKDYTFVWSFVDPKAHQHIAGPRTKLVRHESYAYYTAFARAQYWVVNGWIPLKIRKKADQVAVQCWHGTPLKRLRYDIIEDAETNHRANSLRDNDLDVSRFDYFLSPSAFASKAFISAFNLKNLGLEDIMLESGYPRNDFLVTHSKKDEAAIKQRLGLPGGKKVLLYAPTWRDDQHVADKGYVQKFPIDLDYLQQHLSHEYVILFRAHTLVSSTFDLKKYDGFAYDVSRVDDINDLYVISDVLITDYSSVFFDYANLRRPMIFYMYDLEHYQDDLRGFYFDPTKELPGDIVKDEAGIVRIIGDLDAYEKKHSPKYQAFNKKFNYLDDGKVTLRVVEKIFGN
jgi:CDP-glycerol glycerophosphotransferase